MGSLIGKRAVVVGGAGRFGIGWAITEALGNEGAEIIATYRNPKREAELQKAKTKLNLPICGIVKCDVRSDEDMDALFAEVDRLWPDGFDILVHCPANAPLEALKGEITEVATREAFAEIFDVSTFSLVFLAQRARPRLRHGGSVLTLTYQGAQRAEPHYHMMGMAKAALESAVRSLAVELGPLGVRVNALSPGPIQTVASRGITGSKVMMRYNPDRTAMGENASREEVAGTALFLCTPAAGGITGHIIFVDKGQHFMAANPIPPAERDFS
jgi:enoyl-[acyl-carrier protein] reductase I